MAIDNSKPWRLLALRANFHLGTARILLDLALDECEADKTAALLRSAQGEVSAAQGRVREIEGVAS
jgi:hypothetical protein